MRPVVPVEEHSRESTPPPSGSGVTSAHTETKLAREGYNRTSIRTDNNEVTMFSVIFEVFPRQERFNEYLGLAKHLKPILESIDGFVDNERFESKLRPGWILSHSTWRDEKSVVRWRTTGEHHMVQEQGRSEVFADYHLRVGDVTADSQAPKEAPVREQRFDETETGAAKMATLTEMAPQAATASGVHADLPVALGLDLSRDGVVDYDVFASIYNPGKLALLVSWRDARAANPWAPVQAAGLQALRHRRIRIVRDYGMFDRREAPQFYPDAKGRETRHAKPAR
jgi:heme-degrading monooxygenase HmoA